MSSLRSCRTGNGSGPPVGLHARMHGCIGGCTYACVGACVRARTHLRMQARTSLEGYQKGRVGMTRDPAPRIAGGFLGGAPTVGAKVRRVAVHDHRKEEAARETLARIREHGADGYIVRADVLNGDQLAGEGVPLRGQRCSPIHAGRRTRDRGDDLCRREPTSSPQPWVAMGSAIRQAAVAPAKRGITVKSGMETGTRSSSAGASPVCCPED